MITKLLKNNRTSFNDRETVVIKICCSKMLDVMDKKNKEDLSEVELMAIDYMQDIIKKCNEI